MVQDKPKNQKNRILSFLKFWFYYGPGILFCFLPQPESTVQRKQPMKPKTMQDH